MNKPTPNNNTLVNTRMKPPLDTPRFLLVQASIEAANRAGYTHYTHALQEMRAKEFGLPRPPPLVECKCTEKVTPKPMKRP